MTLNNNKKRNTHSKIYIHNNKVRGLFFFKIKRNLTPPGITINFRESILRNRGS